MFYFYIKLDKRVLKYCHPSFAELSLHKESAVVIAQYVNCAAANPGADAGMYDASDQYKLSTWTQVPHRELPFRDKGGLRRQGQKRVLFVKDTT